MAWYRCACGFLTEQSPQYGDVVVSVYHLHPAARVDGSSAVVRMAPLPDPARGCGERAPETDVLTAARALR
ncbi:MAG TPA: hypothetical protein VEZ44_12250 [bacterium]|nr:hypothetical protein [bacterium]